MNQILEALAWSIFITLLSQVISLLVISLLGLPLKRLAAEIQDRQNPAVGALFFIISLIVALYVSGVSGDGYNPSEETVTDLAWIFGGAGIAILFTLISFFIAHQVLGSVKNENLYQYLRRELIEEENAALAFFLGGLAVAPFLATLQQVL